VILRTIRRCGRCLLFMIPAAVSHARGVLGSRGGFVGGAERAGEVGPGHRTAAAAQQEHEGDGQVFEGACAHRWPVASTSVRPHLASFKQ
jgi:hypothetical protein